MADHIQIGDVAPRIQYTGDGVQTVFTYPFPIFKAADMEVYLDNVLQASGYTVNGAGQSAGGNVTFAVPPASAALVTLRRLLAIQRTSDFQESGEFRAKVINDELDYQTAALQQVANDQLRSLRQSATDTADIAALPAKAARASKVLGFDAAGAPVASTKTLAQLETTADAAAASASAALASETAAASSAAGAAASATTATTQAGNAATKAGEAAASATAAAAAAASGLYAISVDKSADYPVVEVDEGNLIRVDATAAPVAITLPDVTGFTTDFRVAVTKWDAGANAVTVNRSGANTINGASSFAISSQYQVVNFIGDKETGTWLASDASVGGIQTFKTIAVAGQSDVVADAAADTLTLAAGTGVTLTTNAGTDTVTIAAAGGAFEKLFHDIVPDSTSVAAINWTGLSSAYKEFIILCLPSVVLGAGSYSQPKIRVGAGTAVTTSTYGSVKIYVGGSGATAARTPAGFEHFGLDGFFCTGGDAQSSSFVRVFNLSDAIPTLFMDNTVKYVSTTDHGLTVASGYQTSSTAYSSLHVVNQGATFLTKGDYILLGVK